MKTKIFLILAAVMGGAGLAAIGTAMLVQVFRTSAPATTTAAGAPPTAAYTELRQPETEQSPAKMERTSSGEKTVSVTAPDYLRPQSAASALLQPAITPEPATATATQPVATEPSAAQPAAAAQVAQSLPAESATAVVGSVASSAVYVQDVSELAQPSYTPEPLPVDDSDSYRYFYQQLAPLGEWLYISGHGYCWRPAGVSGDWRPYWDGHWAWSECGWTWVSSEPWGGSTYHYGRWMLTSGYGWVWVPGRQWAPAWVCWRHGPGFVGWAPLPPGALSGAAFYREAIGLGVGCWTMVHERDFLAPRCATVALPAHRCAELMPRTTHVTGVRFVHNVVMNTGPAHRHMEQVAGRPLPPMRLRGREATFDDMRTRVESGAVIVARP
ncbi:MAG: hypothetical protein N2439_00435, partial [Anaerolineae bacterium]|nr:hypothetical protein [Anaerolineae bacterium]